MLLCPPLGEQTSAQGFTPGSVFSSRPGDGSGRLGFQVHPCSRPDPGWTFVTSLGHTSDLIRSRSWPNVCNKRSLGHTGAAHPALNLNLVGPIHTLARSVLGPCWLVSARVSFTEETQRGYSWMTWSPRTVFLFPGKWLVLSPDVPGAWLLTWASEGLWVPAHLWQMNKELKLKNKEFMMISTWFSKLKFSED